MLLYINDENILFYFDFTQCCRLMMSPRIDRSFSMTRGDSADDGTPGSPNREDGFFVLFPRLSLGALCVCLREIRAAF